MRNLSLFLMFLLTIAVASSPAAAQKKGKAQAAAKDVGTAKRQEVSDAMHKLKSPNPEEVLYSVQVLAAAGAKDAVGPLTDLLRSGPRNDITNAIIQALGSIGQKSSVNVLIEYLNHRRPDARVAVIYALENFKDPDVTKALEDMLRDSDTEVRGTAALALGKRGETKSVPMLFLAFDRAVYDAAIAIGQLGSREDAKRLSEYLGRADVKVLLPGFDEFLRRQDFPEDAKIEILDKLFELAGPEVKRFAVAYKASFPPGTDEDVNAVYKKVSRMVRQIQEE